MKIDRGWDGYYIKIEGKTIVASRDSKSHKWIFKNGRDWDAPVFHEISEKKGEAILEFLKKLSSAAVSEENLDIMEEINGF